MVTTYTFATEVNEAVIDTLGRPQRLAACTLYVWGSTTEATRYTDETKATVDTAPLFTDAFGVLHVFLDKGKYGLKVGARETVYFPVDENPNETVNYSDIGVAIPSIADLDALRDQVDEIVAGTEGPTGPAGPAGASVLGGVGPPSNSLGNVGDWYIDRGAVTLYLPKTLSGWTTFISIKGDKGDIGERGLAGATILSGAAAPLSNQGVPGDYYLRTTGQLYGPKDVGTGWGSPLSLLGPAGPPGPPGASDVVYRGTWLVGTTYAVKDEVAHNGVLYIANSSSTGITPGTDPSIWTPATLAGPTGPEGPEGPPGASLLSGTVAPTNDIGQDGDSYYNTTTFLFYSPKAAGVWPAGVLLQGPQGAPGEDAKLSLQSLLYDWTEGNSFQLLTRVYDGQAISSGTVKWPDGYTGTYTATISSTWNEPNAYSITYERPGIPTLTVYQDAVTRNSTTGLITAKPALRIVGEGLDSVDASGFTWNELTMTWDQLLTPWELM